MTSARSANRRISAVLETQEAERHPLAVQLHYTTADPYAVHVRFTLLGASTGAVEWVFARSLLERGVREPTGEGDVRIWPVSLRASGGGVTALRLSSPTGEATVEIPTAELVMFLASSHDLCPSGREHEFVDLDAELAYLLQGGRRAY